MTRRQAAVCAFLGLLQVVAFIIYFALVYPGGMQ